VAVTLEELEIFLGVKDDLNSAYQRVDQFATKTEARFRSVQTTMDRAMGKDLLLKYKVDDRELTAANKHAESKRTHIRDIQREFDQKPLTYRVNLAEIKAARVEVLGLKADMRSLSSDLSQQGRITVEYSIDASKFIDKFEKAGDKIAEKIGKTTIKTGGGGLGGLFSIPGAIIQGIGIQVGERISRGFSKSADASLEAFGQGLDKQINRAMQAMTIGLARAGGYSSARDFRRDASQTIDNLTNFSPQRVRRAVKKLEDDLVDVLESAVVDGDQAAVAAKLKKLQTEMLEQPIEAAMNTAGAVLRIGAQPFRIRKRVELSRTVKEAEGMVDEILQNMSDELKDEIKKAKGVTLATGGIDYQKGGENTYFSANLVRKLTPGNVTIPVPNSYSNDPSTLGGLYQARQAVFPGKPMPLDRMLQTSVETGRNPDAAKMLAHAMAVRKIAPDTPITFTGSSGGAALVEEVIGAAERAAMKKIKGVGLTMPGFDLTRTASKANYQTLVGSYDPVAIGAFGSRYNDQSRYFNKAMGAAPFNATGILAPGQSTSVFAGLGTGHHLADFLSDPKVQQKFQSFTGTGNINPGYTGDRKNFGFAGQLYSESQSIPRTIGVILGDLKALSEVAKDKYSFIDPGNPSYRRDNDFAAMSGNFEKLKVSGADAPDYEKFLVWLKTFKRELTAFYEIAGTHEGMMPKGLTDAAKEGQQFFKFREGVSQPEYNAPTPLDLPVSITATEKVLELATNTVEKVNQGLSALAPVGEAATNVLNDVARGLTNIAGGQVQKRVDQVRGNDLSGALAVQGDISQRGTMTEFGKIAAQDIEATKQAALRATEQVIKFADGTIRAGKSARDFFQGLRSQGRTIQDLGDAVVEVSAELVSEFEGLSGTGAADIKLLTGAMAALKGEIESLPPLLPAAGTGINESEKKAHELISTAHNLHDVLQKLSKESSAVSLAQGGVFDIESLQKSLDIIEEIETALKRATYVTSHTYDQGFGPLVAEVRDVQAPLGRLKAGAYRGIKQNLSQVKEAADAGDDTAQGFIDGIESKLKDIERVANKSGLTLLREIKDVLGIASPSKVFIQIGKEVVAGFEIGLEDLDKVYGRAMQSLAHTNLTIPQVDKISETIKAQLKAGNTDIKVNETGSLLGQEKPKVQRSAREVGLEAGQSVRAGIDQASPAVKKAIAGLTDGIINQLRFVAPGITGFIEGIGLDLNKLKALGGAGLTLAAITIGVGLLGAKTAELFNSTADAATEQNRFKRILDQTVSGGGTAYYGKLAEQANKYGVNLALAAKSAASLESSLINKPLAGQGVEILSGFQAQFASQGTGTEDQNRVLVGVEQALRKGKLQAEELYQIIEPLPGGMEALAAATGKTTAELFRATSQGEVFTEDVIQKFSDQLKIQSGIGDGANTAEASMGRLQNQTTLLMANIGQVSVATRKVGTDLFGGALEFANNNAGLLTITLGTLVATIGIGLTRSLITAGAQLFAFVGQTALAQAGVASLQAGFVGLGAIALPVAATIATLAAVKFAWDLSQPEEEFQKILDQSDKLYENLQRIQNPPNITPKRGPSQIFDVRPDAQGTLNFGPVFDRIKEENNQDALNKEIVSSQIINSQTAESIKQLQGKKTELAQIKKLNAEISDLNAKRTSASYEGDTKKVAEFNRVLVEKQKTLGEVEKKVNISGLSGNLQSEIGNINKAIEGAKSNPALAGTLPGLIESRDAAQELYDNLNDTSKLNFVNLQQINAHVERALASSASTLVESNRQSALAEQQALKQYGGPGQVSSQQLATVTANNKLQALRRAGIILSEDLKQLDDAVTKIKPDQLSELGSSLSALGTNVQEAKTPQLEQLLREGASGDRQLSDSTKKTIEGVLKKRQETTDQLNANRTEQINAENDIKKSLIATNDATVEYKRQFEQSNYDLKKAIEDNTRNLKRQLEDTIQETKQLFSDLAKIKLRNDLNSKIQTISGDFSDTVLSSLQSYFDKIAEVMDAKLTAAGIKTGLDRKLEDLGLGQRDFQRGVFNQQQGIQDAAAGQVGAPKSYYSAPSKDPVQSGYDFVVNPEKNSGYGAPIAAPPGAIFKSADQTADPSGYGKNVVIQVSYLGKTVDLLIAHLAKFNDALQPGYVFKGGEILGYQGNTGHTIGASDHRRRPGTESASDPDGTHLSVDPYRPGNYSSSAMDFSFPFKSYLDNVWLPQISKGASAAVKMVGSQSSKASGTSKVLMTDTGTVGSNGLKLFKVDVIDAAGNVTFSTAAYSGKAGAQTLETASQGIAGDRRPIPQGQYGIGGYEQGNFGKVGNQWIGLQNKSGGDRGAFGFHGDVDGIPGSDGCIVFTNPATVKKLADAVLKSGAKDLFVNYGIGGAAQQAKSSSGKSLGTMQASWYGPGFNGKQTADGSIFDENAMTVAHKTLPFGTMLKIIGDAGTAIAKVTDRGPHIDGRDIDLSKGVAAKVGILGSGTGAVKVEVINGASLVADSSTGSATAQRAASSIIVPTSVEAQKVAGAIQDQSSVQAQLSAEKQRGSKLDAAKILRDLANQTQLKTSDLLQQQIGLQSQSKQREFDQLPQTPLIGVLSQLNSKQAADAQAIVKAANDSASLQRDIDHLGEIVTAGKANGKLEGVDQDKYGKLIKDLERVRQQTILTKKAIDENNAAIANANPIKALARDLRIATDAQLGQADAMSTQLDAINAVLFAAGTAPSGAAERAISAQFRAAREGITAYSEATEATLKEMENKAKSLDKAGDTGRATAIRDAAKTIQAAANEFAYSGLALTDGAEKIAKANASLDEAFKKSLEIRKPRDQFEAASQNLGDKQAQLLDASGDIFGANDIKRNLQVLRERKTLTDEIKANELEINKLFNIGSPDSLNAADQLFATNSALEAQMGLLEKLATVSYPSVASSLRTSIADAGSQAFGTLAKAISDGNLNVQTLSDIFKQAGQSIIQTVIEIGQQFIKNQIFNLLGSVLGQSLPQPSGGGINAAPPLIFNQGGHIPNYANGEGYTLPAISAALDRERSQSGGLEPRLVVANTKERILNPKETMLWETIAKYGFRNENYAMGGTPGSGGSTDGSNLSARNSSSNSFGDFVFNGGGSMSPEDAVQLRKDVAGFIDKRIQDTEIQRRRSGK
jgi:rare lipoprotein A